jgi:HPt (histidine-containing phosphotransfer) domain-containing protein
MSQPQLDSPRLRSSLANDEVLRELVELFVEEMPGRAARLHECFAAADWDGLRRAAHQMKGSSGSYGFDQLTPYAADLEMRLNQRAGTEEVADALEALLTQCGRVTAAAF